VWPADVRTGSLRIAAPHDPLVLPRPVLVNHDPAALPAKPPAPGKKDRVTEPVPFVIDAGDAFPAAELFTEARDQVVVAVRITPVYGQVDLGLLAVVVDEANSRGFALAREQLFRDEWLLCVFEAFDDDE
jgi:hypothetical protein